MSCIPHLHEEFLDCVRRLKSIYGHTLRMGTAHRTDKYILLLLVFKQIRRSARECTVCFFASRESRSYLSNVACDKSNLFFHRHKQDKRLAAEQTTTKFIFVRNVENWNFHFAVQTPVCRGEEAKAQRYVIAMAGIVFVVVARLLMMIIFFAHLREISFAVRSQCMWRVAALTNTSRAYDRMQFIFVMCMPCIGGSFNCKRKPIKVILVVIYTLLMDFKGVCVCLRIGCRWNRTAPAHTRTHTENHRKKIG